MFYPHGSVFPRGFNLDYPSYHALLLWIIMVYHQTPYPKNMNPS